MLYFALHDKLDRLLSRDWEPGLPKQPDVNLVIVVCMIAAFLLVVGAVVASLGTPKVTQSPLKEKRLHVNRFMRADAWRLVLEDGSYFAWRDAPLSSW